MTERTIALIGGPATGKTNFLARLWTSLRKGGGALSAPNIPEDIVYVEDAVKHLLAAEFAPRTREKGISGMLEIPILFKGSVDAEAAVLQVPDVMGEEWEGAVNNREIKPEIFDVLSEAYGALLFVRVLSPLNKEPLDWVNAQALLASPINVAEASAEIPTQVSLCELVSFLEHTTPSEVRPRKVAVMITGWDLLDVDKSNAGPLEFLASEFPMFAGKLKDTAHLDVQVFGISVVGGDLNSDPEFKEKFIDMDLNDTGYVVTDYDRGVLKNPDITEPLRWLLAE